MVKGEGFFCKTPDARTREENRVDRPQKIPSRLKLGRDEGNPPLCMRPKEDQGEGGKVGRHGLVRGYEEGMARGRGMSGQ